VVVFPSRNLRLGANAVNQKDSLMDLGIIIALVVLIVWAIGALVMQGPGWIHLLLTVGVSLLLFRIVVSTSGESKRPPTRK
jgi:hypothetical protein